MIYTTYCGNIKNIPDDISEMFTFSIMRKPFKFIPYSNIIELSPSQQLRDDFKYNKINWDEFKARYIAEVFREDNKQLQALIQLARKTDICLICCEKDNTFCHRRILAELIEQIYKIQWREV